jgi:hypothetical protein
LGRNQRESLRIKIFVVVLAVRGELDGLVAPSFGILEDFSFVIADHDVLRVGDRECRFGRADFSAILQDIMKISELEILKTRAQMTVIGGEIVVNDSTLTEGGSA